MDKKAFGIVVLVVAIALGFLLGYSIPPFIHSGVFTGRAEKGVEVKIDKELEKYYESLTQDDEGEDE
jgi:hypothetical protein